MYDKRSKTFSQSEWYRWIGHVKMWLHFICWSDGATLDWDFMKLWEIISPDIAGTHRVHEFYTKIKAIVSILAHFGEQPPTSMIRGHSFSPNPGHTERAFFTSPKVYFPYPKVSSFHPRSTTLTWRVIPAPYRWGTKKKKIVAHFGVSMQHSWERIIHTKLVQIVNLLQINHVN